jgi:1-acyl-sn-glycerol-3-phosphate acyltransferase
VLVLSGYYYVVKWEKKIDRRTPYVVCANHTSRLDILLLFAILPFQFVFMGKAGLTENPILKWFYERSMIVFDRMSVASAYKAYRQASISLENRISVVIFPEGGVPKIDVRLNKFKSGAFRLAISNKVPILPVTFADNKRKLPEDKLRVVPGRLRVFVHMPIQFNDGAHNDENELKQLVFARINDQLEKIETGMSNTVIQESA